LNHSAAKALHADNDAEVNFALSVVFETTSKQRNVKYF